MAGRARDVAQGTAAGRTGAPSEDDPNFVTGSRPATRYYEPLPLGSEAFLAPLPAPPDDSAGLSRRARLLWGTLGVAALLSAGAVGGAIALRAAPRGEAERAEPTPRAEPAVAVRPPAVEPAAPAEPQGRAMRQAAPVPAAARPPSEAAPVVASAPAEVPAAAATSSSPQQSHGQSSRSDRHHSSHRSSANLPAKPDRAQVIAAMQAVQPAVKACFGDARGSLTAHITVAGHSGRVSAAKIDGQAGRIASCAARAVRGARLPRFSDESLSISYPFAR
jgi:hypothetical protein